MKYVMKAVRYANSEFKKRLDPSKLEDAGAMKRYQWAPILSWPFDAIGSYIDELGGRLLSSRQKRY